MNYNLRLVTAPAVEPLSLSEIKEYLKISDYSNTSNGLSSQESIYNASREVGIVNGSSVNVLGYKTTIQIVVGTLLATGKLDCKVQDSNDEETWEDIHNFSQVDTGSDNETYLYEYQGDKQYVRVIGELIDAGGIYGVNILLDQGYASEDPYVQSLIVAARTYCENEQSRAYITQTWEMILDSFEDNVIDIPKGNLQSIDSIEYKDSDNDTNSLTENTDFVVSTKGLLGKICPAYDKTWPTFTPYPLDPIVITFTCGYGDNASDVPEKVKLAMKLLISHWFENRVPVDKALSNVKEVEFTLSSLLWQDRLIIL